MTVGARTPVQNLKPDLYPGRKKLTVNALVGIVEAPQEWYGSRGVSKGMLGRNFVAENVCTPIDFSIWSDGGPNSVHSGDAFG